MGTREEWSCLLLLTLGLSCSPPPAVHTPRQTSSPALSRCRGAPVALEILGSGGPIPEGDRASSSYLVWVGGRARALIDAGGGAFLRFGEAGARIEDLDVVALSHLHADHSGDLAPLLKGGYFIERSRPLVLVGPSGNEGFPSIHEHLRALFDPERGAFRYLGFYLTQDAGGFTLDTREIRTDAPPAVAYEGESVRVSAVGVHHGQIPSLGFLVQVPSAGIKIAFGGDQSAGNKEFLSMARGADALVLHHPIPEGATDLRHLHATAKELGQMAREVAPRRLLLSHLMRRSLAEIDRGLASIKAHYTGPTEVATDHTCVTFDR